MDVTVAEALRRDPLRFLVSTWPLRTVAYVLTGVASGVIAMVWVPVALVAGAFVFTPVLTHPLVAVERRRVSFLGGPALSDPHRPPDRATVTAWLRARHTEAVTWRELAYLVLHGSVLLVVNVIAVLLGWAPALIYLSGVANFATSAVGGSAPLVPAARADVGGEVAVPLVGGAALAVLATAVLLAYTTAVAALVHGALARLLLCPGAEARVRSLMRSRARLIDAFESERRRIERDLHDGAQQRLLRLGMTLVTAQLELEHGPDAARPLLARAAEEARSALAELRELVRGIHPRVLTDLGLAAAVAELAGGFAVPVSVEVDLPGRLPAPVESTAYFVIAEALTNAARHAAATEIQVTGRVTGGALTVETRDNGRGGADPARGTGLTGLSDRVDALAGAITVTSPPGGPTVVRLELPCSA
ncbi:sensor domain-containing protein [Spongiactinospora sp. TRM90649]|uniref:sensor histidine kinase n=1 Tax=Spongiactinospora sp. TRM90649 TaxID=3031114 RepID=UPI0023F801DB|nr:sensor domain-containing protein [Spongiactinospora sp. TRM90649]MDF5759368.1 histidine kinase [Spongiactinospora sp. TRM90649]